MASSNSETAILLIEVQNQWTEKGLYNFLIKNQLESRNVLENISNLVKRGRRQGIKIIHAPLIVDPANKKGWLAYLTFGRVFTKGTRRAKIADGVFEKGDIIVKGRYAFDAFVGSDLEEILAKNNIKTVFVGGFLTDQCVAKTIRTMIKKGLEAYLVADCTATVNDFLQKRAEKSLAGRVVRSDSVFI
ncbi:MAG: cysteine hydrolase [bacterium]|nr:cysteine hydrolase [bacterium]